MSSLTTAATPSWMWGGPAGGAAGAAAAAAAGAGGGASSPGNWRVGVITRGAGGKGSLRAWANAPADRNRGSAIAAAVKSAWRRRACDMEGVSPVFTTFYLKSGRWYPELPNVTL